MKAARAGFDSADAAMLAVIVVWAIANVLAKFSLAEISPLAFMTVRLSVAAPVLLGWVALRGTLRFPARADWPMFLVAGASGFGLYNIAYAIGLRETSAFSVALLQSIVPVLTLLLAALLGMDRMSGIQWAGVALAMAGVVIFVSDKLVTMPGYSPLGDGITFLAAIFFAIYGLTGPRLAAAYGAPTATAWSLLVGLAVILPFGIGPTLRQDWASVTPPAWSGLLVAIFGSSLVAYNLWSWAIGRRGIARTVPYMFLLPVMTGVFSVLMTGERFGPLKIAGAALAMAGVALVRVVGGQLAARSARRAAQAANG